MRHTLLGKKIGMTQVYDGNNVLVPVTVVEAGPCPVIQVKTLENDGYNAVQIGYGRSKPQRVNRAQEGRFKKAGAPPCRITREVRCQEAPEAQAGQELTVTGFKEGQKVDVLGAAKGRGFQGVVKRHGFSRQPKTHGHMMHRRPGSVGMCQYPGRVLKGKAMPGRMGAPRRTVQNLRVVRIIPGRNLLLLKGSVPGAGGGPVIVRGAKKERPQT